MSGEEVPYWCYTCNGWFVLRTEEEVCPDCEEDFVKSLKGMSFWCSECDRDFSNIECHNGEVTLVCPYCNGSNEAEISSSEEEESDEEEEPPRAIPPPVLPSSISAMLTVITIEDYQVRNGPIECPICKEELELGSEVTMMLCHDKFHHDCIARWLILKNKCPVCHQFESDSEDESPPPRRMSIRRWFSCMKLR